MKAKISLREDGGYLNRILTLEPESDDEDNIAQELCANLKHLKSFWVSREEDSIVYCIDVDWNSN